MKSQLYVIFFALACEPFPGDVIVGGATEKLTGFSFYEGSDECLARLEFGNSFYPNGQLAA